MEKVGNQIIGDKCLKVNHIKYVNRGERAANRGRQSNYIKGTKVPVLGAIELASFLELGRAASLHRRWYKGSDTQRLSEMGSV